MLNYQDKKEQEEKEKKEKREKEILIEYESFKKNYETMKEVFEPFHENVKRILKNKKYTVSDVMEKTGLARRTVLAFRTGIWKNNQGENKNYTPDYKEVVAFCIGLELDIDFTVQLLNSAGLTFSKTNEIHRAYVFVLLKYRGCPIKECNEFLRKINIEERYLLRESRDFEV